MSHRLTQLKKCDQLNIHFNFIGERAHQAIRTRGLRYRDTLNQHSPIPTRIYSAIIQQLIDELTEWEKVEKEMLSLAKRCSENPQVGRVKEVQIQIAKKLNIKFIVQSTFSQLASRKCLDYFAKKRKPANVKSLSTLIAEIQLVAKLTIQVFTGMRDDEATSLPYHCTENPSIQGLTHYIILGRTTKFNNGRSKKTRWVTNAEGQRAIQVAQQIAEVIFDRFKIKVKELSTRSIYHPLFPSVGYLAFASKPSPANDGRLRPNKVDLSRMPNLRSRLEPIIEASDMSKLNDQEEKTIVDRDTTLQRFKKGEIAYKETLLGGCTSTEPCKQTALKWINTECLENGCRNLVCKLSKLERVIAAQEKLVISLNKDSVEYRTEKSDLDVLISARDRSLKSNLKRVDSNDH